jgi:SAM-dependent methyltransferase
MGDRSRQAAREVAHGLTLAAGDTEHAWGWGTPAGQRRAHRRADLLARGAGLAPGMRVLEVGCGTGLFTEMLARTEVRLVAIDISRALLEKARARGLPEDRVRFVEGPLEEAPITGPFDAVIGSSVLHHLDLRRALSRVYALLVPGGRVCFAEPNMLNPQVFLERRFRRWFPYVSPDETAFVRWRLCRRLAESGFEEICLRPFDWLHPGLPAPLIPAVEWGGRRLERIPGLRELAGSLLIRCRRPGSGSPGRRSDQDAAGEWAKAGSR